MYVSCFYSGNLCDALLEDREWDPHWKSEKEAAHEVHGAFEHDKETNHHTAYNKGHTHEPVIMDIMSPTFDNNNYSNSIHSYVLCERFSPHCTKTQYRMKLLK